MSKFFVILQYELMTYLKNKSFMITTVLIAVMAVLIMFSPRVIDIPGMLGIKEDSKTENEAISDDEKDTMLIFEKSEVFGGEYAVLKSVFPKVKFEKATSENDLKKKVEEKEVDAGFVVDSLNSFTYYVFNRDMYDNNELLFQQAMTVMNQVKYCAENQLDYAAIQGAFYPEIKSETNVLGKSMENNYWYCYALVIIVFMMIILYGVMVATSVTQEKSNRTIEVLVTSADTNALFFAKVFAGTLAALIQAGVVFLAVFGSYKVNRDLWGGFMDVLLDIPANVMITYILFGLGGLLFYTFIYGAMGALVSKTEDINKSAGGVQMIIMVVYFICLIQLTNIDGIMIKVLSFLPLSSYSAMFARVAMGTVQLWEVIVSFVILVVSIGVVGIIGAKIYRMGTLRYGNPISLRSALKSLKNG